MTVRRRRRVPWGAIALVGLVIVVLGGVAVVFDLGGVGTRFENQVRKVALFLNPPPDRPTDDVVVTPAPSTGGAGPGASLAPGQTPPPGASATPLPPRKKVDLQLLDDPAAMFIHQDDEHWCAVAGTQMVLAMHGKAPLSKAFQKELDGRIGEWESRRDSKNGGWGPSAMAAALEAYGVPGYQVRVYETRQDALTDAAKAIEATRAPVILLAWRGAHTWVMTGFRSDADPAFFVDARVSGAYIQDPWYPSNSSIWGQSDPPGNFENADEMRRNYLPWERPEGSYPNRDGRFIAVVPTVPITP